MGQSKLEHVIIIVSLAVAIIVLLQAIKPSAGDKDDISPGPAPSIMKEEAR